MGRVEPEHLVIRRAPRRFGVLCLLAYVALSWAMRFDMRLGEQIISLVYPLDTFSMYARMPPAYESHLLVRDRQGTVHRVMDFRSFDCAGPLTGPAVPCAGAHGIPYHFEDLIRYVESHPGPGQLDAELITRTWELHAGAAPVPVSDCVLAACRVAR
jgi:hypothetical protein